MSRPPRSWPRCPGDGEEGRSSSTALARDGSFLPQGTVEGWLEDRGCFPRVRWSPSTLPCHLQRRAGLQGFFAGRGHPFLVEYYRCSQLYVFASFCLTPTQLEEILLWFARLFDGQISICTHNHLNSFRHTLAKILLKFIFHFSLYFFATI